MSIRDNDSLTSRRFVEAVVRGTAVIPTTMVKMMITKGNGGLLRVNLLVSLHQEGATDLHC